MLGGREASELFSDGGQFFLFYIRVRKSAAGGGFFGIIVLQCLKNLVIFTKMVSKKRSSTAKSPPSPREIWSKPQE